MLKQILLILFLSGALASGGTVHLAAANPKDSLGQDNPQAEISPEIFLPSVYYVYSKSPLLRLFLRVSQDFDNVFSTELNAIQLGILRIIGVKTEPATVFEILPKFAPLSPEEQKACQPEDLAWPPPVELLRDGKGGRAKVAILDTGVDQDHPDLAGLVTDCLSLVSHFRPDSFSCEDNHGHGTQVAGVIGASGKIRSLAPETETLVIKACDQRGFCFGDDVAAGIQKAAELGAEIIYLGFGAERSDLFVKKAIQEHPKILFVAGAGNDGPYLGSIDYPAAWSEVMAVGAIDRKLRVPDWSSRGINDGDYIIENYEVELAAPGVEVESTLNDGCYGQGDGTSLAAAFAAGVASKLWQGRAELTRALLQHIAQDIGNPGDDPATGFGLPVLSVEPEE